MMIGEKKWRLSGLVRSVSLSELKGAEATIS